MKLAPAVVLILLLTCCVYATTVTGTVTDADGAPVEGAQVWLVRVEHGTDATDQRVAETQTAEDGSFTLEAADAKSAYASWFLLAYTPGLAVGGVGYIQDLADEFKLTLRTPESISGTVVGPDGEPVQGATVSLSMLRIGQYGQPGFRHFSILDPPEGTSFEVQTDASGKFTLGSIPPSAMVTIGVTDDTYGSLSVSEAENGMRVQFQQPGSLHITTDIPDEATPGGSVQLHGNIVTGKIHTGAKGEFDESGGLLLENLQPGMYSVHVTEQPSDAYHLKGSSDVEVRPGERTEAALEGGPTGVVSGRVVARDTGEGIEGAPVSISTGGGISDTTGHFEVPCIVGEAQLHVSSATGYVGMDWDQRPTVQVTEDGADVGEIVLEPAHSFTVIVTDEQDQPVEGASVSFSTQGMPPFQRGTTTSADGTCTRESLEKGSELTIRATKGDLASEQITATVGETEEPLNLVLKEGLSAEIVARVVDQEGNPVTDAKVMCYEHTEQTGRAIYADAPAEDGTIEQGGLVPGLRYQFRVETQNSDRIDTEMWTAVAGETHDFGTITLTIHNGTLAGTVVNADGEAVSGAKVFNRGDTPKEARTTTDANGRFELTGLVEGDVYAFVNADGYEFTAKAAATGTDDLTITLQADEPATITEPPSPREPQLSTAEAGELARKLLLQAVEETEGAGGYTRKGLIQSLAKLDEQAAYEAVGPKDKLWWVNEIVARNHMPEDFDEALAVLKSDIGSYDLVRALIQSAETHKDEHPDIATRCATEALKVTPTLSIPNKQVLYSVLAAEQIERIDPDFAWTVYDKWADAALKLGGADYEAFVRGWMAEHICDRDMDRAMELIDGIVDADEKARHLGNVARHVAKTDPDRALEMVETIESGRRESALTQMLPFFPEDRLDEAIEAVERIESDFYVPRAYGRLAWVVPDERVPEMIEAARDALMKRWTSHGISFGDTHTPQEMTRLAIVAKCVGYSEYEQIALRALSLRTRGAGSYVDTSLNVREDFQTAIHMAHADEQVSRHITESALKYAGGVGEMNADCWSSLAAAAAEVDIQWALDLLEQMPPDDPTADDLPRASALASVVRRLLESAEERRMDVLTRYSEWYPVDEDW